MRETLKKILLLAHKSDAKENESSPLLRNFGQKVVAPFRWELHHHISFIPNVFRNKRLK